MRAAEGVGPYGDAGQNALSVLCADRDETGSGAAVIIVPQAERFSVWELGHGRFLIIWTQRETAAASDCRQTPVLSS